MSQRSRIGWLVVWGMVASLVAGVALLAQGPTYNPYRPVRGLANGGGPSIPGGEWAKLPSPSQNSVKEMGSPAAVHVDVDGESIWAFIRCDETSPVPAGGANGGRFGLDCMYPDGRMKPYDTIYKFDPSGHAVKSFGAGMFIWPHGLYLDREGNVWGTDAASENAVATAVKAGGKVGHIVRKFSPDGKLLMTLGEPGVPGNDENHFRSPAGVVTAPNGDIFVADGHGSNDRVVKYSKDGKFIKAWGKTGYAPGEFHTVHGIAMDKRGRIFVADRGNNRIQIFDQEGKHLATWLQFATPSGIAFSVTDEDMIYVFDSESDIVENPGFEQGIRIGDALKGWVHYFILDQGGNPNVGTGSGAEFGTVDKYGNVFGGGASPTGPAEIRQSQVVKSGRRLTAPF